MGKKGQAAAAVQAASAGEEKRLAKTATKDSPKGILASKLTSVALDAFAKAGLSGSPLVGYGGTLEQRALIVFSHIQSTGKADVVCQECGGEYVDATGSCPFCGDGMEEAAEVTEDELEVDDDEVEVEEDDATEITSPVAMVASMPSALSGAPAKGTALAVVEGGKNTALAKYKVIDLDKAIAKVKALKGNAGAAYWDLGDAIKDIIDRQLWKLRTAEGKPQVYRTFESFCNAELGIQPMSALSARDVASRYSRQEAEKLGRSKMTFLVRADDLDRPILEQAARSGASKRELAKKSKELKAGKPVVERTGKVRQAPAATRPAKSETITVAAIVDKPYVVPLYKKPAGKLSQLADPKSLTRAKNINHEPVGRVELGFNDLVCYIRVDTTPAGEARARLNFVREPAGDVEGKK
jgi:hypothetical protein